MGPKLPVSEFCGTQPQSRGRPFANPPPPPPRPVTFCSACATELGRGHDHDCKPQNKAENLRRSGLLNTPTKMTEQKVVSGALKTMAQDGDGGSVSLKSKRGYVKAAIGKAAEKADAKEPVIDHETLDMMKSTTDQSGRKMLKGLGIVRARTGVQIEPNFQKHMYERNQFLKENFIWTREHFHETDPDAKGKVKGKTPQRVSLKHLVYTPDVEALKEKIIAKRGWSGRTDVEPKIGIDSGSTDGNDMLKVCMVLQRSGDHEDNDDHEEDEPTWGFINPDDEDELNSPEKKKPLQVRRQLKLLNDFRDGGVKKLIILAVGFKIPENYSNVLRIMELLGINRFNATFSCDLKMVNMILGLQLGGATFSCPYCECDSSKWNADARLRTFGDIRSNSRNWTQFCGQRSQLSKFKNCEFEPLIEGEDSQLTIEVVVPPQMHIFMGIANKIWKSLKSQLEQFDSLSNGTQHLKDFETLLKNNGITGTVHGPHRGLIGPEANKLCQISDKILRLIPFCFKEYANCLHKLREVQDACLGLMLFANWKEKIQEFETSYKKLGINMTLKCHILCHDIPRYLQLPNKKPLGYVTEQQFESVHSDFATTFRNFKIPRDEDHENFGPKFLSSVQTYNSNHV